MSACAVLSLLGMALNDEWEGLLTTWQVAGFAVLAA